MNEEIRILILEDEAADVVRINHELREAGLNFRCKRVDTKESFLFELEHNWPDVILSDHGLPSFDGFAALALVRHKCPDVPFIFVTGSMGEQVTIETFEHGATDYVLKNRLGDLAPAIERSLRKMREQSKQHETEIALRTTEERFRLVMEGIRDYAIFMMDAQGRVTFWNAGAQAVYDWNAEEVRGCDFSIFYSAEDVARRKPQQALKTAATEGRFIEEGWRVGKAGKKFIAAVTLNAVHDPHGRVYGYTQGTRDITAHKRAEEELSQSEAVKRFILETAPDAIILIDAGGKIQEWNPAAQKIFGYPRQYAIGRSLDQLIEPARSREIYPEGLTHNLMTGPIAQAGRRVEATLRRADGSEFPAEIAASGELADPSSRCTTLIRDITKRRLAEAALRESEERYRRLVEDVQDYAIYLLDPEGRVASWNTGAERIMGYSAADVLGRSFAMFFTPEDVARGLPEKELSQAKLEGRAVYEGQRLRKNGLQVWIQGTITALRDAEGKLHGFSKVARDVTRQKEADEKIHQFKNELEQRVVERTAQLKAANKELEAFSYSISHDLRAPLLRISGFADILRSEAAAKLDEKDLKYLQTIIDGTQQMSNLIDALLDFSRMGRAELRRESVDMARLVEEAQHELRRETEGRDIEWRVAPLPATHGDPILLRQVVINLLTNALKFTRSRRQAKIEIGAKIEGGETVYFIRDNGVGFDMAYAGKLFGVFQRLHPARDFEGTGIGLANVQRILHRHGGRVWAEGAVNKGAVFYFSLPQPNQGVAK